MRTHCTGGVSVTGVLIYILHILHVVGTADSVLIREVSFIHSFLYGVTGVLIYIHHNLSNIIHW